MTEEKAIPFYDIFPITAENGELDRILSGTYVVSVVIDKRKRTMELVLRMEQPVAPVLIDMVRKAIADEFSLSYVEIQQILPPKADVKVKKSGSETKSSGDIILGRSFRGEPVEIRTLSIESGKVIVEGEVVVSEPREIAKRNAWVMSFDLTDYTSTIRVSKYMTGEDAGKIAASIKKGQYLKISGNVGYNRYDGDISLDPVNIVSAQKKPRTDEAVEKRVELHLHTRYSALDALSDPGAIVKQAIAWGHRAVAITDHGVCQAFPDAWHAAGDKIKILYGVEAYFINDVDDRLVVSGECDYPLDGEIVAFDIETTGLKYDRDRIIEIGAVVYRNGEITDRFQTFVDPERHIPPEITELTGLTDKDVAGAPKRKAALKQFIEFCGNRPLCAHNADFDMGFVEFACRQEGLSFDAVSIDTLTLSQNMLPHLKKFKLDIVANSLNLPEFNHHRASDDAATAALIMGNLFSRLRDEGVTNISEINAAMVPKRQATNVQRRSKHMIILARTKAGLKNLYKLVSLSHLEHYRKNPIIPKSELNKYREGLIIGSACEAGELFQAILNHKSWRELKRIASYYDYLEIQPVCNNSFMLYNGMARDEEELREFNRKIVKLAEELGKPCCATGDVHFTDPKDEIYRHILLTGKGYSDADRKLPLYFKTTDEMLEEFSYLGRNKAYEVVVKNTNAIADMCDTFELLPKELFPPKVENSAEDLKRLVYEKMHSLYGENPPEQVSKRVETELGDILARNYDVIYMSAQKLVADSLEHGYLVGSRGSVGSSLVAFMAGITEVNSLPAHYRCPKCHHADFEAGNGYGCGADMPDAVCPVCGTPYEKDGFDIPFETFLGFGGDKVPDIDLNFSGEYQANAHKYTEELFGRDHVFRAGTIGTLAEKTAYGYVKKYLDAHQMTVTKAEENRLALGCVGVKRTTGQHPGGLVIIPQDMDVTDFCPVQHPADDTDSDIITTHFEYHSMEANLLKLDMLGHDDPTMIKMLEDMTGVDAKKIPMGEPETMKIFSSPEPLGLSHGDPIIGDTGTIGIPEFGTSFTRQMLVDTKPDKFDTLVRLSGFSHGTDVWLGNAKDLILSGTATVQDTIGCRDDIMLYLISKGMDEKRAFKFMESVRKGAIHKGKSWPDGIVEEMQSLGVPDWYIESCRKIQYLFPKAHAVAYVMMAFRIAWFKVHRPLAFYSAYFYRRSQKDSFDAEIMTRGIDTVRIKIREISDNPNATAKEQDLLTTLESCYEFYMRGFEFVNIDLYDSDAVKFNIVGENALRPPFVAISGLGETAARDLAEHRNDREFVSIDDLTDCCSKVSKSHIDQLKSLGALRDMPDTSQISFF